jgi:hypothetical protein
MICSRSAVIVVTFWIRDLNASCVSCGQGDENRGGKGGSWAAAASMVGGSKYQVDMVLDRPVIGMCLRRAIMINSYFLLAEYRPLIYVL